MSAFQKKKAAREKARREAEATAAATTTTTGDGGAGDGAMRPTPPLRAGRPGEELGTGISPRTQRISPTKQSKSADAVPPGMTEKGAAKHRRTIELRRKVNAETEAKESEHPLEEKKKVEKKDDPEIDRKLTAADFLAMQAKEDAEEEAIRKKDASMWREKLNKEANTRASETIAKQSKRPAPLKRGAGKGGMPRHNNNNNKTPAKDGNGNDSGDVSETDDGIPFPETGLGGGERWASGSMFEPDSVAPFAESVQALESVLDKAAGKCSFRDETNGRVDLAERRLRHAQMYKEINQLPKTKAQMYNAMLEARGELALARHEIRELRAAKRKLDLLLHVENSKVLKLQKSDKEQKAQLRELRKHRREANMLLKSTMNELEQERLEAELERKRIAQELEADKVCTYFDEITLTHTGAAQDAHARPPLLTLFQMLFVFSFCANAILPGENQKRTGG